MLKDSYKILKNQKGLSLIEILISLTILGIAGTFITGKVFQSLYEGQVKSAKIQMQSLAGRLKEFRRHCNFYPSSEQGLDALVNKPTSGRECKKYAAGGYIENNKVPLDPWDNDFVYVLEGKNFNIISLGADGDYGGEDEDKDIYLNEDGPKSGQ